MVNSVQPDHVKESMMSDINILSAEWMPFDFLNKHSIMTLMPLLAWQKESEKDNGHDN